MSLYEQAVGSMPMRSS